MVSAVLFRWLLAKANVTTQSCSNPRPYLDRKPILELALLLIMLASTIASVSVALSAVSSVALGISGPRSSAFVAAVVHMTPPQAFRSRAPRYGGSTYGPRLLAPGMPFELNMNEPSPIYGRSIARGWTLGTDKPLLISGGAVQSTPAVDMGASGFGLASAWGVLSVVFILMNAVKRLAPIALQPFQRGDFTPVQWAMYGGFSVLMAYMEGFKGFQRKFSPLVVKRALTLDARNGPTCPFRLLFAGPYSMGLFHASKKRRTVSWGLTLGVVCLVQIVKRLPYPWRSIVDAGVVVGLSYGMASICMIWAKALMGNPPTIDPAMPEPKAQ